MNTVAGLHDGTPLEFAVWFSPGSWAAFGTLVDWFFHYDPHPACGQQDRQPGRLPVQAKAPVLPGHTMASRSSISPSAPMHFLNMHYARIKHGTDMEGGCVSG